MASEFKAEIKKYRCICPYSGKSLKDNFMSYTYVEQLRPTKKKKQRTYG
jgi:hypothetical protein